MQQWTAAMWQWKCYTTECCFQLLLHYFLLLKMFNLVECLRVKPWTGTASTCVTGRWKCCICLLFWTKYLCLIMRITTTKFNGSFGKCRKGSADLVIGCNLPCFLLRTHQRNKTAFIHVIGSECTVVFAHIVKLHGFSQLANNPLFLLSCNCYRLTKHV